jgi:hypothetical protein
MQPKHYNFLAAAGVVVLVLFILAVGFIGLLLTVMIKETRHSGYPYLSVENAISALPITIVLYVFLVGYFAIQAWRAFRDKGEA